MAFTTPSNRLKQHTGAKLSRKFKVEQHVMVETEWFCGRLQIVDFDPHNCHEHDLPRYHLQKGDDCFTFCENELKQCN